MPLLMVTTFCNGIVTPNAIQGAVHPFPDIAGIAGAVVSSTQMLFAPGSGALVGALSAKGPVAVMTGVMSILSLVSLGIYSGILRPAEREANASHPDRVQLSP